MICGLTQENHEGTSRGRQKKLRVANNNNAAPYIWFWWECLDDEIRQ